jgi:hypothetical protein
MDDRTMTRVERIIWNTLWLCLLALLVVPILAAPVMNQ